MLAATATIRLGIPLQSFQVLPDAQKYLCRPHVAASTRQTICQCVGRSDSSYLQSGRSNRKSVGSPEAVTLRSAPPMSGVVNIQTIMRYSRFIQYRIRSAAEQPRWTNSSYGGPCQRGAASLSPWRM
eukprot:3784788-Pleurochrysis_carterae.AAC.4